MGFERCWDHLPSSCSDKKLYTSILGSSYKQWALKPIPEQTVTNCQQNFAVLLSNRVISKLYEDTKPIPNTYLVIADSWLPFLTPISISESLIWAPISISES